MNLWNKVVEWAREKCSPHETYPLIANHSLSQRQLTQFQGLIMTSLKLNYNEDIQSHIDDDHTIVFTFHTEPAWAKEVMDQIYNTFCDFEKVVRKNNYRWELPYDELSIIKEEFVTRISHTINN